MPSSSRPPSPTDNRDYYDRFAQTYDAGRGGSNPGGYHDLIDDLEVDFLSRHAAGRRVLEVGCGTGLILARIARIAQHAEGVDLSPKMLEKAAARGLTTQVASATSLPFPDASFDLTYALKVLPHVQDVQRALAEMVRVTRPGGVVVAEFYNPRSIRGLLKRLGPAGAIAGGLNERAILTRFDTPSAAAKLLPSNVTITETRGIRILTPSARAIGLPLLGPILKHLEWRLADSPLKYAGGFWIVAAQVQPNRP